MSNKNLSLLKTAANVAVVAPLVAAIAKMPKHQRPVEMASFATSFNSLAKNVVKNEVDIINFVKQQPLVADMDTVAQYISNSKQFVELATAAKFGSINYPFCNVQAQSSGFRIYNVGTKSNLRINLGWFNFKLAKTRYISEFVSYKDLTIDAYNSIMGRIFIYADYEENGLKTLKEVYVPDFFLKLALIQSCGISLDSLMMNPEYLLCLKLTTSGYLKPIPHPMCEESIKNHIWSLFEDKPLFTEPTKANEGYIGFDIDTKGLLYKGTDGKFYSFLAAKKFVARQEKLNGDVCVAKVKTKVFLVTNTDKATNKLIEKYFNTGCFYASHKLLMSIGACRVTSDINNLLIKGVTHYAPWILGETGNTISICASSSAKGGIAGLAANKGFPFNFEVIQELPSFNVESLTLADGTVVEGVYCDVVLKITNAFTIENFMRNTGDDLPSSLAEAEAIDAAEKVESLVGFNKKESAALSKSILSTVGFEKSTVLDVLETKGANGEINIKPAVTTFTQGEFENIALTYGDDVAIKMFSNVLTNKFNKSPKLERVAAATWLLGKCNKNAKIVNLSSLLVYLEGLVEEYGYNNNSNTVSSLNTVFARQVVSMLGLVSDSLAWIHIPELNVFIPTGKLLYKDLFNSKNDVSLDFQLPKILKYVLSTLFYLLQASTKGDLSPSLLKKSGENLHFMIQDGFLSKAASKLKAHGKYVTLLPGFWLKNKHDICILSRDLYQPQFSHLQYTKVNMAKHPVIFLEAVAGFKCYNEIPGVEVSDELRLIYANTVFVHPDYLLELQNDCDGDLARVTFDTYTLPYYKGLVLKSTAKQFHQNYINDENDLGIDIYNKPKQTSFSHEDVYAAIKEASTSKMNVAIFTDNLHKLQAAYRSSSVTARVVKAYGQEIGMQLIKDAVILVATLIQTDAMNAIKHDGGVTCGDALTAKLINSEGGYIAAKQATIEYIEREGFVINPVMSEDVFAGLVASLMFYTHNVEVNHHKENLVNQYERLAFKDQPNEIVLVKDENGKDRIKHIRLDWYGKNTNTEFTLTSECSMFAMYYKAFYGSVKINRSIKKKKLCKYL